MFDNVNAMNFRRSYFLFFFKLITAFIIILAFNYVINNVTLYDFKRRSYNIGNNIEEIDERARKANFSIEDFSEESEDLNVVELKINNGFDRLNLKISINRSLAKEIDIKRKGTKTLFIEFDNRLLKKENIFEIESNHNKWTIEHLRIKNVYGYSSGLFSLDVVNKLIISARKDWKRDFPSYEKFILLLFLFLIILVYFIPGSLNKTKTDRKSIFLRLIFWALLFVIVFPLLVQSLSKYRIIYSFKTVFFLLLLFLLLLSSFKIRQLKKSQVLIPVIIFLVFLSYTLYIVEKFHKNNFTGMTWLRNKYFDKVPLREIPIPTKDLIVKNQGYDTQFYYYIAFDPLLRKLRQPILYRGFIDSPRYRYSRIGFPLLINAFSLGIKEIFPETMVLLVLFSHLFGAFFLLKIIEYYNKNPGLTFLYLLIPGYFWALWYTLPESIAGTFFLAGYYYYLRKKPFFYIPFFSFAIFVRETVIFFIIIFLLYNLIKDRKSKVYIFMSASIIPYLIWKVYLTVRLYSVYGISTFYFSPKSFTWPLLGFYELYKSLHTGNYKFVPLYPTGYIYPIILLLIFIFSIRLILKEVNPLHISLIFYSFIYMSLNFEKIWAHMGNGIRGTYDIFLFLIFAYVSGKDDRGRVYFFVIFLICLVLNFIFYPLSQGYTFGLIK